MLGIGIDIVQIGRFQKLTLTSPNLVTRIFHNNELSSPIRRLAGKFSVKESVKKALGAAAMKIDFRDIIVSNQKDGAPIVSFSDNVLDIYDLHHVTFMVSLSYVSNLVVSNVVAIRSI